ncbi:hypothetical protein LHGZ1_1440 [Laribacter hongkongensis]|uniref:Uncharacterized protein n=1 Tax=Laribacter hongkongensis TaxID=168471 RepID=A0A248LIG4_9NEIS|nr:hypothetical protein LHGZ1_1440 [Laribacter hongkongensis]
MGEKIWNATDCTALGRFVQQSLTELAATVIGTTSVRGF